MIKDHVSPDDFIFIEKLTSLKIVSLETLAHLLDAVSAIGRSKIEILPLELATVKICTK